MARRIWLWVKRVSPSRSGQLQYLCLALVLFLLTALSAKAQPVRAEFTDASAEGRSFQPMRLSVTLSGRERRVQLELQLPSGGRISPELSEFKAGGRTQVQILNVYVPGAAVAGAFTVHGAVIDGARRWPFEATIRVRARTKLLIQDEDLGFSTVRSEETVKRSWRIANKGNVLLRLRLSSQPTTGAKIKVEPRTLALAPGETQEIVLSASLEKASDQLVTLPLFLNVDSGEGSLRRRETVGFTAEFVPREAGTGPLFAELSSEVLVGGVISEDHQGFAGRLRVEGEVLPGVNMLAYGTDGTAAPGGSRLGLATRDYFTAELRSKSWHATGGLVDPPPFGFLESSTQGRGGTLAWLGDSGLTLTALGARESYGDFTREHVGLHLEQSDPDSTGWIGGLLAQRNKSGLAPTQERIGGFAQTNWLWQGLTGSSQLALAHERSTQSAQLGVEQRLDYRTADERTNASLFIQSAPSGFFLGGRSSELRDASLGFAVGEMSAINLHWSEAREEGLIRSYTQAETEAGLTPTNPELVELITRTGSRVQTWSAAYAFKLRESRAHLVYSETERKRDSYLIIQPEDSYRERVLSADWSRSFRDGRLFFTGSLEGGSEENLSQAASFAESSLAMGGQLMETLQFSTELRHTWHMGGEQNTGYRQPGTYARSSLIWTPRPRWHFEAGFDGYKFGNYPRRVRSYALFEAPLTDRVALATEISHDQERTSFWLAARIVSKIQMPWRPVRGAFTGRVLDTRTGSPVAGARMDLGGKVALSDAKGRFTLPGSRPGLYPLSWSLPPEYLARADWPRTVTIKAGTLLDIDLGAQTISLLQGRIEIKRGSAIELPTGSVSASNENGEDFETMAAAGDFKLLLPPGLYTVRYTGESSADIASQLVAKVIVGANSEPVNVFLGATEKERGMRRTFFQGEEQLPIP
jgi:hypothetical protein